MPRQARRTSASGIYHITQKNKCLRRNLIMKQRNIFSNTYMNVEVSPRRIECTYNVGKILKIEIETPDYDANWWKAN